MEKVPYICGPLTELGPNEAKFARSLYEGIANICKEVFGARAFVPHEHYDPIKHAGFTPVQVDEAERRQVCELTSVLIVVPLAPSWGGGIEVEMAHRSGVPTVIICEEGRKISRLLRGNPSVIKEIAYERNDQALSVIKYNLIACRSSLI